MMDSAVIGPRTLDVLEALQVPVSDISVLFDVAPEGLAKSTSRENMTAMFARLLTETGDWEPERRLSEIFKHLGAFVIAAMLRDMQDEVGQLDSL